MLDQSSQAGQRSVATIRTKPRWMMACSVAESVPCGVIVADQLTRYCRPMRRTVPPTPITVVVVLFTMTALAAVALGVGGLIFGGGGAIGFSLIALLMTAVFALTAHS